MYRFWHSNGWISFRIGDLGVCVCVCQCMYDKYQASNVALVKQMYRIGKLGKL